MAPESIIDRLGSEITAIVSPVSICMLLVVLMVRGLTPNGSVGDGPAIGSLVYNEKSTDSGVQRFEGALLNALVFIVSITLVTFGLVACFWLRCTKLIWGYMGFSGLTILAWLGGSVAVQVIQLWSIPIDIITFSIVLYNFAVVGVMAVFFCRMPIFLTQSYLVVIGAVVAFWFTHLPEWTTWLLLVAMAIYDLIAVLMPGGPLKVLVELAQEREEDIPALIYEARPSSASRPTPQTTESGNSHGGRRGETATLLSTPHFEQRSSSSRTNGTRRGNSEKLRVFSRAERSRNNAEADKEHAVINGDESKTKRENEAKGESSNGSPAQPSYSVRQDQSRASQEEPVVEDEESQPLVDTATSNRRNRSQRRHSSSENQICDEECLGEEGNHANQEFGLPDAIKLGLGDFIFYSVLVGRAAMYDLMTVYACYLGIVAGLGATLVLLAVFRKALPALPISIALGVLFYLLTRLVMDPFIVSLATQLVFL